ncbi:MAG TPA: DUF305 domain-containing protein [Baekduia sp.]|nr:DUF305 domain-containing protein [Baekduia sp.]
MRYRLTLTAFVSVLALAAPTGALASPTATAATANAADKAFVREMVPHHEMAVEMADMAKMDATHKAVRQLARRITKAQNAEISMMKGIAKRLGVKVESMPENGTMGDQMMSDLETLGVSMDDSGMMMDMHELHGAKPFDRKFIDMMIPHHQGAIRMARAELAKGTDSALRKIARGIVSDQAKEIRQMNAWRKAWYGTSSPGGGN